MKTVKHHSFTLWIHSDEYVDSKVSARSYDEGESFDSIMLDMLTLDELGIICSLTCETWSTIENVDVEELVK